MLPGPSTMAGMPTALSLAASVPYGSPSTDAPPVTARTAAAAQETIGAPAGVSIGSIDRSCRTSMAIPACSPAIRAAMRRYGSSTAPKSSLGSTRRSISNRQ